jgi:hypothetical protein
MERFSSVYQSAVTMIIHEPDDRLLHHKFTMFLALNIVSPSTTGKHGREAILYQGSKHYYD